MQIKAPLLLSACLALARAVQLSDDSPNGHYVVSVDANGTETITHNAAYKFPTTLTAPPSAKLRLRDLPAASQSGCDTGHVDPNDLAHAQAALGIWCDNGNRVKGSDHSVFKYNSVTAYMCSYGQENPCSKGEEDVAFNLIGQKCGFPAMGGMLLFSCTQSVSQWKCEILMGTENLGWYYIPDWKKTYGYIEASRPFCTNV